MSLRAAAERALEALIWESEGRLLDVVPKITADAIVALRAALEQEEADIDVAMMKGMDKGRELERQACLKIIERYQATEDRHPIGDLSGAWMVTAFEEIKATIQARAIND